MSRITRQPMWWIALTIVYAAINILSLAVSLPEMSSLLDFLRLPMTLIVVCGATAFALGFRFGSARLWWAVAVLFAADYGPYLTGIVFRLARHSVNHDYVVYRSTSSYFVTIFLVGYGSLALIRILQSFRDEKALAQTFA